MGIEAAMEMFAGSPREGSTKIMVIITDGVSTDQPIELSDEARTKGITIISIGTGLARMSELLALAGGATNLTIMATDFTVLNGLLNGIMDQVCVVREQYL